MSKRKPKINGFFYYCDIEVFIFSKEVCNYERLTYDSFLYEQIAFISFIYIFLSVLLLLLPCQKVQFFATNSLLFIILFSSLIFNFETDKNYFWILDIIYLLLIIFGWYFNYYIIQEKPIKGKRGKIEKVEFNYLNFIKSYSVSGFLFGAEIVEIRTFGKFY